MKEQILQKNGKKNILFIYCDILFEQIFLLLL